VKISSGYQNGEDVLSFANASGISGSWNAGTATLTLSGDASVANYQAALRNVQFENTGESPTPGTRTISFTVNDGTDPSNAVTRNVVIEEPANQPPAIDNIETATLTYDPGSGKKNITSNITISDPDNETLQLAQIYISEGYISGEDMLSFTNTSAITGTWDAGNATLILTGDASLADYQQALQNVQFENTNTSAPISGTRTISFRVNDGSDNSNTIQRNISINQVNRAPVLSNIENSPLTYNLNSDPINITSEITVSDIDGNTLLSASVKIIQGYIAGEDALSLQAIENISVSWDQTSGTLNLGGLSSISNYQRALRNVKYTNLNATNPSTGNRIITLTVNDGELNSNSLERLIDLNTPPAVSNVEIVGTTSVCKLITGSYTYSDAEGDLENYSTFRWLRSDTPDGIKTAIPEASSITYTISSDDQGKNLFFEVTPQAQTGSISGNPVLSSASAIIDNTMPTAVFSGSATICEGTTANVTITFTGNPPFNFTYTDGTKNYELNTSDLVNNIPVTTPGNYTGVLLSDHSGCDVNDFTSSATITTKPSPNAKITSLNKAYSLRGVPVDLEGNPAGGIFSGNGVVTANNTFNPALAGVENSPHPIVYTFVDPVSGCFDSDTVMIEIIDADASISGLRPRNQYCNIDIPTVLTGVNIEGSKGTFSITGNVGLTDHNNNTATLNPNRLQPGNYTISYSYTQEGTSQTVLRDISINRVDDVILTGLNNSAYCTGSGISALGTNYQLGTFEGNGIESRDGAYFFNPKKTSPGDNPITFRYTNSLGCVITDTVKINMLASTKPSFKVNSTCWSNSSIPFLNTTARPDSVTGWKWLFGDSVSSATDNQSSTIDASHVYSSPGNYTVQLITTNLNNCLDTTSQVVHLGKKPESDMQWDKECVGRNDALHINNTTISEDSIISFAWTIKDSSGETQSFKTAEVTQNFRWHENYTIKLTMNTIYGCTDSVSRTLRLGPAHSLVDSSYYESFDKTANSWNIETISENNWKWQLPAGSVTTAHSGIKTMTSQFAEARTAQQFIVSSPCFDFTGINRPYIELWINSAGTPHEEGAVLQFRTENSDSWTTAGSLGSGINWYNSNNIASSPAGSKAGWSGNTNGWVRAAHPLDEVAGKKNVKLRLIYNSASNGNAANMFVVDDVLIGTRNRTSLFENFTNLSANNALDNINQLNEVLTQSNKDVVSLEYHASFPGIDSLNADNTADPGARILHYGIGVVPYGLLDGGTNASHTYDFVSKKPSRQDIIAQSLSSSLYLVDITTVKAEGNITGKVIVTALGDYSSQKNSLFVAIVEDIVVQSGNSSVTLYNVVKKFLPSAGGTSLKDTWTNGEQVEIPFNWDFVKVYNHAKVKIVAFIQSDITKEVLQASANEVTFVTSAPPALEELPEVASSVLAPNPARDYARLIFPNSVENDTRFEMFTMNGKLVRSELILRGTDVFEFMINDLVNGIYIIKINDKGNFKTFKLTVNR
jgi:hypothetical protein